MNINRVRRSLLRIFRFGQDNANKRTSADTKAEGFPGYVSHAKEAGMDVNDWIESKLGWQAPLPILEVVVFPFMEPEDIVCELGVGTGRWSRHLLKRLNSDGRLLLIDHSQWIVLNAQDFFKKDPRVFVYLGNGQSLPIKRTAWVDLIFSDGTFIELKLGTILNYAKEFQPSSKNRGFLRV